MAKRATDPTPILSVVDQALALLADYTSVADSLRPAHEPLPSLLAQCEALTAAASLAQPEPVRTLHHFACTGGTLIAKCLAVMPNVALLSEIDPLSKLDLHARIGEFAPTDLILGMRGSLRDFSEGAITAVALASIKALHAETSADGRRLVLRDHTHSHFCNAAVDFFHRPTLRALIAQILPVVSVVTVRHPIDSFVSLRRNGWVHFSPDSLEEYCQRYHTFLDAYADAKLFRYEDMLLDTEFFLQQLCEALLLNYKPGAGDLIDVVRLSGDSGRSGDIIASRPRRKLETSLIAEMNSSPAYTTLCDRLDYDPGLEAPQLEK